MYNKQHKVLYVCFLSMRHFLGNIREKLVQKNSVNKLSSDDFDFWWKMEKVWEESYIFESYGQQTKIEKYDEELFSIWGIVESEKNIKLVADFMNRWKHLAAEWYRNSIENCAWVSFDYTPDYPENNVSVVVDIEFDVDPEESWDEYEAGYWTSQSIIEKNMYSRMNENEKYIIRKNAATMAKYLNDRAKEVHIDEIKNEESVEDEGA